MSYNLMFVVYETICRVNLRDFVDNIIAYGLKLEKQVIKHIIF